MNRPRVAIVILNWNNSNDTLECLRTLEEIGYENYAIVLVDNGSTDGSPRAILGYLRNHNRTHNLRILAEYDLGTLNDDEERGIGLGKGGIQITDASCKSIHLILNAKNQGFSGGCNRGIVYAFSELEPDYILLLNNDVSVVSNFLGPLVDALESNLDAGIVGPKILSGEDECFRDTIDFAGGSIDLRRGLAPHIGKGKLDDGSYDKEIFVDYVEGSCMLIRTKTIAEVGLFDDCYFAYWEETDFCMRARNRGHRSMYCPASKVRHKGVGSSPSRITEYLMARNRILFEKKNASERQMIIFLAYFFLWDFLKRIAILVFYWRDYDRLRAFVLGVHDALWSRGKSHFDEMFEQTKSTKAKGHT